MRSHTLFSVIGCLLPLASLAGASTQQSSKRGLVFVPNDNWLEDNDIWIRNGSGLTWYYNFQGDVSSAYASLPQDKIEFVPMMWGAGNDTFFLGNLTEVIKSGRNISHLLTFNEPDQPYSSGGSDTTPAVAAQAWVDNILPLREKMGIKVGLPVMGHDMDPHTWLDPFLGNCSKLAEADCGFDFVPIHSYGDFSVLQSRVKMFSSA
jgi:Glycosyl hydrolase catalytic core